MADLSDVESALVGLIAGALFPSTTYLPGSFALSAAGTTLKAYRGWPESATLANDLAAGKAHVSVFPLDGMTRNTTRFFPVPFVTSPAVPTLTATASGAVVTLGGTATAGNVVGVAYGSGPTRTASAYAALAGDTPTTIAAALAAKIAGATASGPVLTLPSPLNVVALTMVPQSVLTEVRRQDQGFRVSCWCPTPAARDAICAMIDAGLAGLRDANGNLTQRFTIKPGDVGWLRYKQTGTNDLPSRDRVWRRDLLYTVEYPTTAIEADPLMLFGGGALNAGHFGDIFSS